MHFHIDQNALASLARHMVHISEEFTIDQLEQLRAAAFNVVWRRRSDWDRTALLQELRGLSDR
ncbi:TAT-binding protein-like protein 7, AAA ATPase, partial [Tilletia horrida]